jgi:hypothetical protein
MKVFGADWAEKVLHRARSHVGSEKVQYLARQANRNLPELRTHDRFGNRIDIVKFHPAYLDGDWGHAFGTMPKGLDTQAIVDRSRIRIA